MKIINTNNIDTKENQLKDDTFNEVKTINLFDEINNAIEETMKSIGDYEKRYNKCSEGISSSENIFYKIIQPKNYNLTQKENSYMSSYYNIKVVSETIGTDMSKTVIKIDNCFFTISLTVTNNKNDIIPETIIQQTQKIITKSYLITHSIPLHDNKEELYKLLQYKQNKYITTIKDNFVKENINEINEIKDDNQWNLHYKTHEIDFIIDTTVKNNIKLQAENNQSFYDYLLG